MAKLTWAPKPHAANLAEIADFAELECLRRADRNVSVQDVARVLQRQDDDATDDATVQRVAEGFRDLITRASHCGPIPTVYPFEVNPNGTLVQLNADARNSPSYVLYFFLLLATRLNMKTQRRFAGLDATILFEKFCVVVAKNFWGGPHAEVKGLNFGTGRLVEDLQDEDEFDRKKFKGAVDELCAALEEGVEFDSDRDATVTAKDGKLDIVVWRSFSDGRCGRLIGFGQCKTGTNWADDLTKTQPQSFVDKWVRRAPAVLPVRLYFVCDRVLTNWYDRNKDGGIFFDRCRLMEYSASIDSKLRAEIEKWTKAAASSEGLEL